VVTGPRDPRGPVSWHGACPRCGRVFHFIWTARWHNRRCRLERDVSRWHNRRCRLERDVSRETSAAPEQFPYPLSLKCRLYGDRPHSPCSGTIDDGTDRPCGCPCHVLQEISAWPPKFPGQDHW
jgi:hypothetical protein